MNDSAVPASDPLRLAVPGVAALRPYQPGRHLREIMRAYGLRDVIKLASNENPLGPGTRARAALENLPEIGRYPDGGAAELRAALAERHDVQVQQITLGNGSNEVLELAARAVVSPAHEVLFAAHSFIVYQLITAAIGAGAVQVPVAADYGYEVEAFLAALGPRARLLFLANPNNPTGAWLNAERLRCLLAAIPPHLVVVLDQAYAEYAEAPDYPDCIPWIQEFPNLVVTRTFSKIHGLAGLRVGYAVSHPDLADLMNRVRQPFNVNSLGQLAALEALGDESHVRRSRELNRAGLEQLRAGLNEMSVPCLPARTHPQGNFLCLDLGRDAAPTSEALLRRGVIVRPIAEYGLPGQLRVSVGLESENQRFLKSLAETLEDST